MGHQGQGPRAAALPPAWRFLAAGAGWLEEPFPPYLSRYTRYEFGALIDDGAVSVIQPDLSRGGGITEALRIAALASAAGLPVCTHGCHTGLNFAASVHFLASIENAWCFEADGSADNPLRTQACSPSYALSASGTVLPLEGPGLGVEVDEAFLRAHPLTDGAAWH